MMNVKREKKINLHNLEENFQCACICRIKKRGSCLYELFYIGYVALIQAEHGVWGLTIVM